MSHMYMQLCMSVPSHTGFYVRRKEAVNLQEKGMYSSKQAQRCFNHEDLSTTSLTNLLGTNKVH